jgi:hypothetical protein
MGRVKYPSTHTNHLSASITDNTIKQFSEEILLVHSGMLVLHIGNIKT